MKALTIRQPWAWLITRPDIEGALRRVQATTAGEMKPVENRSWPTKLRGDFLIHAAVGMTRGEYEDVVDFLLLRGLSSTAEAMPAYEVMPRGGIVGVANLTRCVESHSSLYFFGRYGFTLANVRTLPFTRCKGALGFWTVPETVKLQLALLD